jgi:FMN phosphatase YigB (HAD superfamily)
MIKALIFDWGDTIMRDIPGMPGPMADWETVEWIPGAKEALELLSNKYLCIIATNASASDTGLMKKALGRLDAEKFFQFFFSSKELGVEKPDPGFFCRIASLIEMGTRECVHIGNLYEKDITGAKQSGMFTVFYNEKSLKGAFPDADVVIGRMEELPQAIFKLEK